MKYKSAFALALSTALLSAGNIASAQSTPAATQQLQLSAFAGATGTFTNLEGGKNLGITAGIDLTFLRFRLFRPSFEGRGTYPVNGGHINSQKNFPLGPKAQYPIGRFHPYADFLFGRGEIDYHPPFVVGDLQYLSSNTFVYSPGVGLDYNLTHSLAIKADAQFQHWNTPVTASGTLNPTALTIGVLY